MVAPPLSAADLYRDAEALADQGRHAEAAAMYERFLGRRPGDPLAPAALMAAAWSWLKCNDAERALDALRRLEDAGAHERMPDLFLYTSARAHRQAGEPIPAEARARELIRRFPLSPLRRDGALVLAWALKERGASAEALAALDELATRDPRPLSHQAGLEAATLRLDILYEGRDEEAALDALERVLPALSANERETWIYRRSLILDRLDRPVVGALRAYLAEFPLGAWAGRVHGNLAERATDPRLKATHLRQAILLGDQLAFVAANRMALARLFFESGERAAAEREWTNLIARNRESDEAVAAIGLLFESTKGERPPSPALSTALEWMIATRQEDLEDADLFDRALRLQRAARRGEIIDDLPRLIETLGEAMPAPTVSSNLEAIATPMPPAIEPRPARPARRTESLSILIVPYTGDVPGASERVTLLANAISSSLGRRRHVRQLGKSDWFRRLRGLEIEADIVVEFLVEKSKGIRVIWTRRGEEGGEEETLSFDLPLRPEECETAAEWLVYKFLQ
jgi:tetratricopeptide (TPR) repeat protein